MTMQPELPWAVYARTSTLEAGEKSSPLKQFMACVAWAKANGKVIPGADAAIVAGSKVQRGRLHLRGCPKRHQRRSA
jgi:hypothetical protein